MNKLHMPKTIDYMEMVREHLSKQLGERATDYRITKVLQINHASMSRYMNGKGAMDDKTAVKVAELLNLNPLTVITAVNAERSRNEKDREFWEGRFSNKDYRN